MDLYNELNYKLEQLNKSLKRLSENGSKYAEARFKRDVAEAIYKANQEAINTLKLEIRLIESQLQREWTTNTND